MESVDKSLDKAVDHEGAKKSYQSPELVTYGDIRLITQAATTTGAMNDGGMVTNTKT